ncbi:MAG: DUF4911 domain-containing protein [Thermodesulfobacteriota bacterium]|jgi:hypothetical protein
MAPDAGEVWVVCRVPVPDLVRLRYTLEAYEGLCVATTLPGGLGRVRLLTSAGLRSELEGVLGALAAEMPLVTERWGEGLP